MKTSFKRLLSLVLVVLTLVGCAAPVLAADAGATSCKDCEGLELVSSQKANCEQEGYDLYYCSTHGKYVTKNWAAKTTSHRYEWKADEVVEGATCEDVRYKKYVCADCDEPDPDTAPVQIAGGNHTYNVDVNDPKVVACGATISGLTCTVCKATNLSYTADPHNHKSDATPGCTGTVTETCERCGDVKTGVIVEHEFVATVKAYPYDCQPGVMEYKCSECGVSYEITIEGNANGHKFAPAKDTNATCKADGFIGQWTCTVKKADGTACGEVDPDHRGTVDPQKDHEWGELVAYKDAICGKAGNKGYKACTTCAADTKNPGEWILITTDEKGVELATPVVAKKGAEVIAAKTHNWIEDTAVRVEPDCSTETNGTATLNCTVPNCPVGTKTETIKWSHDETVSGVIKPTCNTIGFAYKVCNRPECAKILETETIPALNHTWYETETFTNVAVGALQNSYAAVKGQPSTEERNAVAPTCYKDGTKAGVYCVQCGVCVTGESVDTNRPEHTYTDVEGAYYKAETCTENGWKICTVANCGNRVTINDITGHDYKLVPYGSNPVTCVAGGQKWNYCERCKTGDPESIITLEGDGVSHPVANQVWTPVYESKATCEEGGKQTGYCTLCKKDLGTKTTAPLGHKPLYAVDESLAGEADYKKFAPVSGHDADNYIFLYDAECESIGKFLFKCANHAENEDYHWIEVEIPATGHLNQTTKGATTASCEDEGNTGDTVCDDCGKVLKEGTKTPAFHTEIANKITANTAHFIFHARKEADCVTPGNIEYVKCQKCKNCYKWNAANSEYELVNEADTVLPANKHNYATLKSGYSYHCPTKNCTLCKPAAGKYCDGKGLTDAYKCTGCDAVSETEGVAADTRNYTQEKIDAPANWTNGHEAYNPIDPIPAKCWKDGYAATWGCEACGYTEAAAVISKDTVRHTMKTVPVAGDCVTDGYVRNYCEACEEACNQYADFPRDNRDSYESITNFKKAEGHLNSAGTVLPTEAVECDNVIFGGDYEAWEKGDLLDCACGYKLEVGHQQDQGVEVPADCITLAHTIYACRRCNKKEVVVTGTEFADKTDIKNHVAWSGVVIEDAGFFNGEKSQGSCAACKYDGEIVTDNSKIIDAYRIRLEVVGAGENFTAAHSSKIQVKVIIENIADKEIEISKLSFSFVTSDILTYNIDDIKYTGTLANQFAIAGGVTDEDKTDGVQTVNVLFTTLLGETIAAGEELAIATLEFTVKGDITATEAFVINQPTTFVVGKGLDNYKGDVDADATAVNGETAKLGDIDGDGAVTEDDAYALTLIALAEEQTAEDVAKYDIDKDGVVTGLDLYYIQNFIVGNITYEQLCATAPAEAE